MFKWLLVVLLSFLGGTKTIKIDAQASDRVQSLAWNVDNSRLAVSYDTGTLEILDPARQEVLTTLQVADNRVFSANPRIVWHPDNPEVLAVTSRYGSEAEIIKIYNVVSGQILNTLTPSPTIYNGEDVRSMDWSPDGTMMVGAIGFVGKAPINVYLDVWDVVTGEVIQTLHTGSDFLESVVWSPDGTKIAVGTNNNAVTVWETQTWEVLFRLRGHRAAPHAIAWSPDGSKLLSASGIYEPTIRMWDAETGRNIFTIPNADVSALAWHPTSQYFAIIESLSFIQLWEANTGVFLGTFDAQEYITTFVWNTQTDELTYGTSVGRIASVTREVLTSESIFTPLPTPTNPPTP